MRKIVFFLAGLLTLSMLFICPVAISAEDTDKITVIDDAGLFGNNIDNVEAAAAKLEDLGADVRIRTIETYGNTGNLDLYEEQLEQQSPSWQGQDGERKNNLIVIIIALEEQKTGLYYGSYWGNLLEDRWPDVIDNMNFFFPGGDYADGVIVGLEDIQNLILQGSQTTTTSSASSSSSNGWIAPLVIILILCIVPGSFMLNTYRKNRNRQQAARQKAVLAKQGAASGINELTEKMQMLEIKVDVITEKVTADEARPLKEGMEKAREGLDHCSVTYSELSHSAGDPENPKLGEEQLKVIEPEYRKILEGLRETREAINDVEKQLSEIQNAIEAIPQKIEAFNSLVNGILAKQEELKNSGYRTDYVNELIAGSKATLKQAQVLSKKKQPAEALKYADAAMEQAIHITKTLEELPQKKQETQSAIPALAARIETVKSEIDNGRDIFNRLFMEYAESTWESVRGNGTEAENRIDWATDAYHEAVLAAKHEEQDWLKAMDMVEKGNNWLTEAESLIKSIIELEINLKAAERDFPAEIDAAEADIKKACDYINKYDDDIRESLEDDLRAAEKKVEESRSELNKEKPDFFMVCRLAREANESADNILIQARNEHEAAERLRAKAASAKRDATSKVSIAKEYIQDHSGVVKTQAKKSLADAEDSLRLFDTVVDTEMKIALAEKSQKAAEKAYTLAKRDFNNASTVIPIFIPTPFAARNAPPSSWGTRYSGSSSGGRSGGSSSSWGSRSGGGSSSWGGGGSRGGGFSGGGHAGGGSRGW
jgi:uncharacterized membrane protein YgcG